MKNFTQAIIVLAIAGAAFLAGRAGAGAEPAAYAAPPENKKEATSKSKQQKKAEPAGPDEEHKKLELLLGDWDADVKIWFAPGKPPMTFKESVKRESLFDNRFVLERVDATSDTGPYHGLAVVGYNNAEKRYEMFFVDNGGSAMNMWTGTFDAAGKSFTFTGHEFDMNGKKVKFRTSLDCSKDDTQIKEGFKPGKDGREFKSFEVTLTRKK